tara:strand:- start:12510 stop:12761 length:252 start_codon:yes stop_codon:yes gene_type:complete
MIIIAPLGNGYELAVVCTSIAGAFFSSLAIMMVIEKHSDPSAVIWFALFLVYLIALGWLATYSMTYVIIYTVLSLFISHKITD